MTNCPNCGATLPAGVLPGVPAGVLEGEALIQSIAQAASVKLPKIEWISAEEYLNRPTKEWR